MGQRTQVFIEAEDFKGNTRNYLLHQQWGYGLGLVKRLSMLLERLSMLSTKETFDEPIDFNKFYPDFDCLEDEEKDLRERKLTEEEIQELLFKQDNNNGWLVVKLKATRYPYCYDKIKFGFYDWDEDDEYIEFFSMKEYLEKYEVENEFIEKTLAYIDLYIDEEEKDFDFFEKTLEKKLANKELLTEEEIETLVQEYPCVYQEEGDSGRWTTFMTTVVEVNGKNYAINWQRGLTEMQENEYLSQPYECELKKEEIKKIITTICRK